MSERKSRGDLPERTVRKLFKEYPRPKVRGACHQAPKPCPYVSCHYHLWGDYVSRGIRKDPVRREEWMNRDPTEMLETCALDVADRGGEPLETIGEMLGVTRERIRQIEVQALDKMWAGLCELGITEERFEDMFSDRFPAEAAWPSPIQSKTTNGHEHAELNMELLRSHITALLILNESEVAESEERVIG